MSESAGPDTKRRMLRHALATLAYRGAKATRDAPEGFETFRAAPGSRAAGEVLAHIGDLIEWALSLASATREPTPAPPRGWREERARFFRALEALDAFLASPSPLAVSEERIFQGPIADALTHVGQIAMLRRLAGAPVKGENYSRAEIVAGRVGPEQAPPVREFD